MTNRKWIAILRPFFVFCCVWLSGWAQQVRWIKLSTCTKESAAYTVFKTDTCLPIDSNTFHKWSVVVGGVPSATSTNFQFGRYSDANCTQGVHSSIIVQKSCVPIIPPGSILPVYDVLYIAELLTSIPGLPSYGWIDKYYAEGANCADRALVGFSYIALRTCIFDWR